MARWVPLHPVGKNILSTFCHLTLPFSLSLTVTSHTPSPFSLSHSHPFTPLSVISHKIHLLFFYKLSALPLLILFNYKLIFIIYLLLNLSHKKIIHNF